MADRGIIFSAPMVKALLADRKFQTRRLLNPQPIWEPEEVNGFTFGAGWTFGSFIRWPDEAGFARNIANYMPNAVGDRLYVRETCRAIEMDDGSDVINYLADFANIPIENSQAAADRWHKMANYSEGRGRAVPSIHQPRWASRLWLLVKDVRVQRLQDICEADAIAEGLIEFRIHGPGGLWFPAYHWLGGVADEEMFTTGRSAYRALWDSLHTKPGERWADNPWVVAYTWPEVNRGNIDAAE